MTEVDVEDPPAASGAVHAVGPGADGQPQVLVIAAPMPRTAKVIRLAVMAGTLLDEARRAPLDQAGRQRIRLSFDASVGELSGCLPPHLAAELRRFALAFTTAVPSQAELRIAQAQLAGWLQGLLENLQATIDSTREPSDGPLATTAGSPSPLP